MPDSPASRLIYGFHAVQAKLRQDPEAVLELYVEARRQDVRARELLRLAEQLRLRVIPAEGERLDRLVGTRRHQGVVAKVDARRKELKLADLLDTLDPADPALILVLDGIPDAHNLVACLRGAGAGWAQSVVA